MKKLFSKPPEPKEPQSSVAQSQEALELARQLAQHPAVQNLFSAGMPRSRRETLPPDRNDRVVWASGTSKYDLNDHVPAPKTPNEGQKGLDATIAFLQKALEKEDRPAVRAPAGAAFQEALGIHPVWGQYPAYLRPKSPDQMNDINVLRKAQSWQRRKESLPPLDENQPRRIADLPEEKRPKIYRPIKCQTCKDQKVICRGWRNEYRRHIVPCPDCVVKERGRRTRCAINHRWSIDKQYQKIANMQWISGRSGTFAADQARAAQQQIIQEMPSQRTLFLYGVVGVGKSRLLAEIALVARQRGLSSILKTANRIKNIIQNFPLQDDPPAVRAEKQRLLTLASEDLRKADVLLIDELDDVTGRYFQGELLDILSHRIAHGLTTCFAANASKYERRNQNGEVLSVNFTLDFLSDPIKDRLLARGNLHINMCKDKGLRNFVGV